jgi:hypothetical protein
MYLLPKTVADVLDKQRRIFFWQGGNTRKKYRLIKWVIICKSKNKGGFGNLKHKENEVSLLCKWRWKLENEEGLWQDLIKAKNLQNARVGNVSHKMGSSPVWTDLLKIKPIYLRGRQIITKNGKHTLFWKDSWLGDKPICVQAPVLFDWCEDKDINVCQFLSKGGQLLFNR